MPIHVATSADYLQRTSGLLSPGSDWTVMLRVRFGLTVGIGGGLYRNPYYFGDDPAAYSQVHAIFYADGGDYTPGRYPDQAEWIDEAYLTIGDSPWTSTAAATPEPHDWIHLASVQSGTTHTLYINGVAVGTYGKNWASAIVTHERIGTDGFSVGDLDISEFRSWQAALTGAEIQAEMASATAVRTSGLWMDTPLTPTDLTDHSGNGRNWTAAGSVADATPIVGGNGAVPCCDDLGRPFGGGDSNAGPVPQQTEFMELPEWSSNCVGGGTVPSASPVSDSENWAV